MSVDDRRKCCHFSTFAAGAPTHLPPFHFLVRWVCHPDTHTLELGQRRARFPSCTFSSFREERTTCFSFSSPPSPRSGLTRRMPKWPKTLSPGTLCAGHASGEGHSASGRTASPPTSPIPDLRLSSTTRRGVWTKQQVCSAHADGGGSARVGGGALCMGGGRQVHCIWSGGKATGSAKRTTQKATTENARAKLVAERYRSKYGLLKLQITKLTCDVLQCGRER